jgi:nucleoside-diphosphate-sugar epimerase
MKVFLTGSTGFIGGHVAREFAAQGAELRLLVRKTSRLDNLQDLKAETVNRKGCVLQSPGARLWRTLRRTTGFGFVIPTR